MKSHILVFLDDNGTEQSAPFTEVRFDGHFDSYRFEGVAYNFMQPMLEAIYNKKRQRMNQRISKRVISASTI